MLADWGDAERRLSDRVSVLIGTSQGRYPSGNSLVVRGASESIVIDPSIDVVARGGVPIPIDAVLNSHSHEDHMPGNGFFTDARVHIHHADLPFAFDVETRSAELHVARMQARGEVALVEPGRYQAT